MIHSINLFCCFLTATVLASGSDLVLGSAVVAPGGSTSLSLNLTSSGTSLAAVQWAFSYSPVQLTGVSVITGPASAAAGKTLSCLSASGTTTCLVSGLNGNAIGTGTVAFLNATLAPGASAASVQITRALASDNGGNGVALTNVSGGIISAPISFLLTCTPTTLSSAGKSNCSVTLSQSAPAAGSVISLASNNSLLSVPPSVTVPAGATSAGFTATAGSPIASNQNAVVTGTSGSSSQTVSIGLTAPPAAVVVSSLNCSPSSLSSGARSTCSVSLNSAAPAAGTQVTLSSNNTLLTVPPNVTLPGGSVSATFTAQAGASITSNQSAGVTASVGASSQTATIGLTANAAVLISNLSCSPLTLRGGGTGACTVTLNAPAANGGSVIALRSDNSFLMVPAAITAASGATTATFKAVAGAFQSTQSAVITASLNGSSATATLTLSKRTRAGAAGAPITMMLQCTPQAITPGGVATCELTVPAGSSPVEVALVSTNEQFHVPDLVTTRPHQSTLTFEAESDLTAKAGPVTLTATAGDEASEQTLQVTPALAPVIRVPSHALARAGAEMTLKVLTEDPSGEAVPLRADSLPQGASFDTEKGTFFWTPSTAQAGTASVRFTAVNSARQSTTAVTEFEVDGGVPAISSSGPLCSPGGVASVQGKWLAGTNVRVNGTTVPVLNSSQDQVDFLCPAAEAGAKLEVEIESAQGVSQPVTSAMQEAIPRILTVEGLSQGMISFEGTGEIAMQRNYRIASHPAQPGDELVIRATGLGSAMSQTAGAIVAKLGGVDVVVESLEPVPGYEGIYGLHIHVPAGMTFGKTPVQLQMVLPGGRQVFSNSVSAVFEPVRQ